MAHLGEGRFDSPQGYGLTPPAIFSFRAGNKGNKKREKVFFLHFFLANQSIWIDRMGNVF